MSFDKWMNIGLRMHQDFCSNYEISRNIKLKRNYTWISYFVSALMMFEIEARR